MVKLKFEEMLHVERDIDIMKVNIWKPYIFELRSNTGLPCGRS